METKRCSACYEIKTIDCFAVNKSKKNGLSCYCKVCAKKLAHERYLKNREIIKEKARLRDAEWRKNNPGLAYLKNKKWREKYPEKALKQIRRRNAYKRIIPDMSMKNLVPKDLVDCALMIMDIHSILRGIKK